MAEVLGLFVGSPDWPGDTSNEVTFMALLSEG